MSSDMAESDADAARRFARRVNELEAALSTEMEYVDRFREDVLALTAENAALLAAIERVNALALGAVSMFPPPIMEISTVCRPFLDGAPTDTHGEDDRPSGTRREPQYVQLQDGRQVERSADCRCCDQVWRWSGVGDDGLCLACSERGAEIIAAGNAMAAALLAVQVPAGDTTREIRARARGAYDRWRRLLPQETRA